MSQKTLIKLIVAVLLAAAALVLVLSEDNAKTATCLQTKAEFEAVASIANATGQLPDGEQLPTGGQVSVNPGLCKVSFDAPVVAQREAREIQGNTDDFQVGVNPQQ